MRTRSRWVLISLGIAATSILLVTVAGVLSLDRFTREVRELEGGDRGVGDLGLLLFVLDRTRFSETAYLTTTAPLALEAFGQNSAKIRPILQRLESPSASPERREQVAALVPRIERYLDASQERVAAYADGRLRQGVDSQDIRTARQLIDEVSALHAAWEERSTVERTQQLAHASRAWWMVVGSLVAAGILAVCAAWIVLRTSRQRDRARTDRDRVFEYAAELIIVANKDGTFRNVNPAWTTVLGWERTELIGRPFMDFVHPDDREATLAEFTRVSEGSGRTIHFENRYRGKDGGYRRLAWTGTPVMPEGVAYGLARDVTELRAAEAELGQLRGLLPICSSCHKIRAKDGDWTQLETYIARRSGAEFTHSICPDCSHRLYGG